MEWGRDTVGIGRKNVGQGLPKAEHITQKVDLELITVIGVSGVAVTVAGVAITGFIVENGSSSAALDWAVKVIHLLVV